MLAGQALKRESDGKAVVLLDEMGTGTEPTAGSALSIALLKALVRGGSRGAAFTMATTHHGYPFLAPVSFLRHRLAAPPALPTTVDHLVRGP